MKNYKMIIQYDGIRYRGWQKQGNTDNTIQGKLEAVAEKLAGTAVPISGAGRTDAGVHAIGQVANFKAKLELTADEVKDYFNRYLPKDIAVLSVAEVPFRFHSRLNSKAKKYLYRINNSDVSDVFNRDYVWQYEKDLDIDKMRQAAEIFVGEHDFMGFSSLKKTNKSTVREIYSIDIIKKENEIKILFYGDGFLYNMIRIIIGSMIEFAEGKKEIAELSQIFDTRCRQDAGITIPPCGLSLLKVEY